MNKLLVLIFQICCVTCYAQTEWKWAKQINSTGATYGQGTTFSKDGHIYVTGGAQDSSITLGSITTNNINVYVAKYDTLGNALWVKGARGRGYPTAIVTDQAGNVYITGGFQYPTLSFGPVVLTNPNNSPTTYIFLAKYDSSGNFIWAKGVGHLPGINYARSITVDANGDIYIAGETRSPAIIFGSITLNNIGGTDGNAFIAKYSPSGEVIWAKNFGGSGGGSGAASIRTDAFNHIFLGGNFSCSTISFGSHTLNHTPGTSMNAFLVKCDLSGNALWARSQPVGYYERNRMVALDDAGNAYLAGCFSSTVTIGTTTLPCRGEVDMNIVKYDPNGNIVWVRDAGGANVDDSRDNICDRFGNVYVLGEFNSPILYIGDSTMATNGNSDLSLVKYDPCGNVVYAENVGNTNYDAGLSLAIDNRENIYITGRFGNPGISFGTHTLTGTATNTMFLTKWNKKTTETDCQLLDVQKTPYHPSIVSVFPNPVTNTLTVTSDDNIGDLQITNIVGEQVYRGSYDVMKTNVDVTTLPSGLYFIKVNNSEIQKFIKH